MTFDSFFLFPFLFHEHIWCLFGSIALGYSYWVVSFMGVHGFIRIYENNMTWDELLRK
jgi:hypothetical protein